MIQRVQSLYMLVATVIAVAIIFSGFFFVLQENEFAVLGSWGIKEGGLVFDIPIMFPTGVLALLVALVNGYALFMFKNRKLQITLLQIGIVLAVTLLAYLGVVYYQIGAINSGLSINPMSGVMHPVLIVFAEFLALRGVKKDEALVRSVDRLR